MDSEFLLCELGVGGRSKSAMGLGDGFGRAGPHEFSRRISVFAGSVTTFVESVLCVSRCCVDVALGLRLRATEVSNINQESGCPVWPQRYSNRRCMDLPEGPVGPTPSRGPSEKLPGGEPDKNRKGV